MKTYSPCDISIVITCFREGSLLRRAMASLQRQDVQGFEILLVNDASSDDETNAICRELENSAQARVIWRKENGGLSAARNDGFENMSGEIAIPLDADDELPEGAVRMILETFQDFPEADFVYGDYLKIAIESGKEEQVSGAVLAEDGWISPEKLARNWIFMGASPCKKSAWEKAGKYAQVFSYTVQDVDFWRRVVLSGAKGKYIPNIIYRWYVSERGMNSNVREEHYLPLRIKSMPFYEKFAPEMAVKMADYIRRYLINHGRLNEAKSFIRSYPSYFSSIQKMETYMMNFRKLYVGYNYLRNKISQSSVQNNEKKDS